LRQVFGKASKDKADSVYEPRAEVGIPGFDEIIGGGFPKGRVISVSGEPGAGKTIFCSQFLWNGITKFGENGLYVSMDENRNHYDWEMNQFGWNFSSAEKDGKFSFVDASPIRAMPGEAKIGKLTIGRQDFSLLSLLELIRNNAKAIDAKRIVIDPVSMLIFQYPDETQRRKAMLDVVEAMAETGATCLLAADLFFGFGMPDSMADLAEALRSILRNNIMEINAPVALVHGTIIMETVAEGRTMERIIRVGKMRGMQIDRQPRPYRITEKGIEIYSRESVI
jgi:KaiC/GvpD/RAD55 family RecA-like ATPase